MSLSKQSQTLPSIDSTVLFKTPASKGNAVRSKRKRSKDTGDSEKKRKLEDYIVSWLVKRLLQNGGDANNSSDESDDGEEEENEPSIMPNREKQNTADEKGKHSEKLWNPVDGTITGPLLHEFSATIDSVGCLYSQNGRGTAFRVGEKHAMTALHVIFPIICPHGKIDPSNLCKDTVYIMFSDQGKSFKLAGVLPFYDRDLDVAIVEFRKECVDELPPPLSLLAYGVPTVDEVALMGYGNPRHGEKCLEPRVKVVNPKYLPEADISAFLEDRHKYLKALIKLVGEDPESVDKGYGNYKNDQLMLVNAHMRHGASGSPFLSTADPSALKVIGMYTSGYPAFSYKLPTSVQYPPEWTFEAGIKMKCVYDALSVKNKELANQIFEIEVMDTI